MTAIRRIFNGVANDVYHHLLQTAPVTHNQRQALLGNVGQLVSSLFGIEGIGPNHTLDGLPEGESGENELCITSVQAAEGQ